MDSLAFYCVCDSAQFLGLVGLINSLRFAGHDEKIYVLDRGLAPWQREILEPEAVLMFSPNDGVPVEVQQILPLECPAEVMVLLDVDIIVTENLGALVTQAARTQKPVLFLNDRTDRFHQEWEALGFGPPVPHRYLTAGQFVLPAGSGAAFLHMLADGLQRIDVSQTHANPMIRPEQPFYYFEMDILNAMVGTVLAFDDFTVADRTAVSYWPFEGLNLVDAGRLECMSSDGHQPLMLHHIMAKPWNGLVAPNVYSHMLSRLLVVDDVSLQVPADAIPRRLRTGWAAALVGRSISLRLSLRSRIRWLRNKARSALRAASSRTNPTA